MMKSLSELINQYPVLHDNLLILAYRGSIAHGMYVPQSNPDSIDDKDLMGVIVPPIDFYMGTSSSFPSNGTKEIKEDIWDVVVYEAKKFIYLLSQGNPNVLSLLWLEDNYYLKVSEAGRLIIANRDLFVGRHVYKSFSGYAYSQLHRMTHGGTYQGHASAKRKELVARYGYDTKNAAHLIRLLRMGIEFLKDGELNVLREDASQLLEIKRGEWALEQVKSEADRLFVLAQETYINSTLPKQPDLEAINSLSVEIVKMSLGV
jgi:predicted nucleotidyltransferase